MTENKSEKHIPIITKMLEMAIDQQKIFGGDGILSFERATHDWTEYWPEWKFFPPILVQNRIMLIANGHFDYHISSYMHDPLRAHRPFWHPLPEKDYKIIAKRYPPATGVILRMPEPDFDLDEIERAQQLMEG